MKVFNLIKQLASQFYAAMQELLMHTNYTTNPEHNYNYNYNYKTSGTLSWTLDS